MPLPRPFPALVWLGLSALLLWPGPVGGEVERPEAARRIVKVFDFEERDVNVEPVPMNWVRAVNDPPDRIRPGFPRWNEAGFDDSIAVSGQWSVKLPTRGGSTSIRLSSGVVPAIPGADYAISAKVRTSGLSHARAQMAARLLDTRREPIAGSESRAPLVLSENAWADTGLTLRGDFKSAAWIQIDLELLQPDQYETPALPGSHRVVLEDIKGAAWFDDVVVRQLPRVELRTDSPADIIVAPEAPTIVATVHDLTGESLGGRLSIEDLDGRLVQDHRFTVAWGGRPTSWKPTLPGYGWYRAGLEITGAGGGVVSRRDIDFVYAPASSRDVSADRQRFGLIVEELPESQRAMLPALLRRAQTGAINLAIWNPSTTLDALRRSLRDLDAMMEALLSDSQSVTFTLAHLPDELVRKTRVIGDSPLGLLTADPKDWAPYLDQIVSKYGQRVRRWQVGATGDDFAFWRRGVAEETQKFGAILARLAPEPLLELPWKATLAIDPGVFSRTPITLSVPQDIRAEGVRELARSLPHGADLAIVIEPPSTAVFGRRAPLVELAQRVVEAWRLQARSVEIRRPWLGGTGEHEADGPILPTPELAVFRQLVERLAGRRIVADLPAGDGVVGYILQGGDSDAIVAWNDHAEPENAVIRAYLGQGGVNVYDLFGNSSTVYPENGVHQIAVGEAPVFVEGVDVNLARFRAGVRVEPAFVASTAEKHDLELVLENPWPVMITGRLRISEPSHWKISPRVLSFNIAPGKSQRLAFEAGFGVAEEAGPALMQIEVELSADKRYPPITLSPKLDIGLPYVQLNSSYRIEEGEKGPDGKPTSDLVVTLVITNIGAHPLTMQAFALAPDFPREQAPVSNLTPSESIVKRFVFRGGAERLKGSSIRVGLIETDGLGRLNKTLKID